MAVLTDQPDRSLPGASATVRRRSALWLHVSVHRTDYTVATILALIAAVTRVYNLDSFPAWHSDEGYYVSQAWSVLTQGKMSPYTYWYDHPPGGWIQLAGWFAVSGALVRHADQSILAGREFMVMMSMVAAVLLYVLARRVGMRRCFAVLASLLFVLSPLTIAFSRHVLLDNIAMPWALASMVLILSPARKTGAAAGSAVCLAMAALSKETALMFAPALMLMAWQHYRQAANRVYVMLLLLLGSITVASTYLRFALLKGELWPSAGKVSLWEGQLMFQLATRTGSGSVFDPQSMAYGMVSNVWLPLDEWLPLVGALVVPLALLIRPLRGPAIVLLIHLAYFLRGGYIPFPFIVAMMPMFALVTAGVLDWLWPRLHQFRAGTGQRWLASAAAGTVILLATPFFWAGGAQAWLNTYANEATARQNDGLRSATAWVKQHVAKDAVVVTESDLWLDIVQGAGLPQKNVIMTFKLDADPDVLQAIGSFSAIDYLVVKRATLARTADANQYPTVISKAAQAELVASFGRAGEGDEVLVLRTGD